MTTTKNPMPADPAAHTRGIHRFCSPILIALFLWALPCRGLDNIIDLGPLFAKGDDIETNALTTAAGPVYESRVSESGRAFRAVRPFYSVLEDGIRERRLQEFLWPLGMVKDFRGEKYWRFLSAYGNDFDTSEPDSRYRFVIFPILFTGRDAMDQGYFAIFPLGGRINEYLGQDRLSFVLFPLYGSAERKQIRTHSILWPIVEWSSGGKVERFRVFPFYGESHSRDSWKKRFILWPFWTSVRYEYPDNPGSGFILFPFYGHVKAGDDNASWMFLPPLFRFSRSDEHVEFNAPWPIIQYASGEKEKMYVWPLWGRRSIGPVRSWFCIWPILSGTTIERESAISKRFLFLPFIQHETRTRAEATAAATNTPPTSASVDYRYLKLWPLLDYRRRGETSAFRTLALWPFRNAGSMDRNYTPFWTLYSHVASGTEREDKFLWGLFRWRRSDAGDRDITLFPLFSRTKRCNDPEQSKWSFLMGLAGYRREGELKTYRLLYFLHWQTGTDHADP